MVARRGNAPRSAGCEPAVLLLNYRAKKKEVAERQGLEPWTPMKVQLFSRQFPRPTGRAPFLKWLLPLASHQAHTA